MCVCVHTDFLDGLPLESDQFGAQFGILAFDRLPRGPFTCVLTYLPQGRGRPLRTFELATRRHTESVFASKRIA